MDVSVSERGDEARSLSLFPGLPRGAAGRPRPSAPVFRGPVWAPDQLALLPPSLSDCIPVYHPVRLLASVMEELNLSALYAVYPGGGAPAYDPAVLIRAWIYGLCQGIRSSRKLEEALRYDLRFLFLSSGAKPDYRTLCRFRRRHEQSVKDLFAQTVLAAQARGLAPLECTAVDGTKLEANVSAKNTFRRERLARKLDWVDARIAEILAEVEDQDRREGADDSTDPPGPQPPPSPVRRSRRRDGERRPARVLHHLRRWREALLRAQEFVERTGAATVAVPDLQSRLIRTTMGNRPAYNAQAAVDGAAQIIVAATVVTDASDNRRLPLVLEEVRPDYGTAATEGHGGRRVLQRPHSGRSSGTEGGRLRAGGPEGDASAGHAELAGSGRSDIPLRTRVLRGVSYRVYRNRKAKKERRFRADYRAVNAMCDKLAAPPGRAVYALRQPVVEPVFGRIKQNFGLRRLVLRGQSGAGFEYLLACCAHNLAKIAADAANPQFCGAI